MRLLFNLPFWMYFVISVGLVGFAYVSYTGTMQGNAERAEALGGQPPEAVAIEDFNPATDTGLAREVQILAQVAPSTATRMTYTRKGVDRVKHFLALYPTDVIDTSGPALGYILESDEAFNPIDLNPFVVDGGAIGPVVQLNGLREGSAGKFRSMIDDVLTEDGLTKVSNPLIVDPFMHGREEGLKPRSAGFAVAYGSAGLSLLSFFFGFARMRRRPQHG